MNMETNTDPLVRVRNLKVAFQIDKGTIFEAVKGISFDIPRNTCSFIFSSSAQSNKNIAVKNKCADK